MEWKPSKLVLEDGSVFEGLSPHWQDGLFHGEVVFSTGMTGYCESLTDPSYTGQILAFTYPLIGNYGVPDKALWESDRVHASGVIVSGACECWSHHEGRCSLVEWLREQQVPLIAGVDTRRLTIHLRSRGVMRGIICGREAAAVMPPLEKRHPVSLASPKKKTTYKPTSGASEKTVVVVDCGAKENIIRSLRQFPFTIHRVPFDYDYTGESFDGVFLSNGPGDPMMCEATVSILRKAMDLSRPIYGICLGAQMMALAAGARTYKLRFGHRGHNQPAVDTKTGRGYITSQNHGYAVDATTLPEGWEVSFRNLNDDSVEGIRHVALPFAALQFHPEACPGPTDTQWFFKQFYETLLHYEGVHA